MAQLRSRPAKTETVAKAKFAITKKKPAVSKKPNSVKQTFTAKDDDIESKCVFPTNEKNKALTIF